MPRAVPIVAAVVVALCATRAQAQVIRRPATPTTSGYMAFAAGYFQTGRVDDGSTQSTWDFGDAVQYRITLEKALQNQSSIGIAATFGRLPLVYSSAIDPQCSSCDADATVTELLGTFHLGGDQPGLHQVIDLDAGARMYSAFRERATGRKLAPSSDVDLSFAIGYGLGYTMSPGFQLELVQEVGGALHQRTGLAANANTLVRSSVTRIGLRIGL